MAAYGVALKPWYILMTGLMRVALLLLARWRVEGKEAVPPGGPLIIVCNHLNGIDPPLLAASVPRPISFLAKRELFKHGIFGPMVKAYGALPIRRGQGYRGSLERLLALLASDRAVGLFPEGTRSRRGRLSKAKPGVALVAVRSGAPILPVGIHGSERIGGIRSLFTRPEITVSIGQPFTLPVLEGPVGRAQLTSLTDMLMRRIAAQLPMEYRGEYGTETPEPAPSS